MTTCATCRHWLAPEPGTYEARHADPHGYCEKSDTGDGIKVLDRGGEQASLYTRATFGCALYEGKA